MRNHAIFLVIASAAVAAAAALIGPALPSRGLQGVTVGIDADPGAAPANSAASLGTIEACTSIANEAGRQFTIDVFVDQIPSGEDFAGFNYGLEFDSTRFKIAAQDHALLLDAAAGSSATDVLTDPVPDTTSPHVVAVADLTGLGTAETGPIAGVLGRYTLEVLPVAQGGLASFSLSDLGLFNSRGHDNEILVDQTVDGLVALGGPCPSELPTPEPVLHETEPAPAETPQAGQTPATGDQTGGTPNASATPGQSGAVGAQPSPGAGTVAGSESAGGDDGSWAYIAGGVGGGLAVALAVAGALWWRRRRPEGKL